MRVVVDAMLLGGRHTGVEVAISGLCSGLAQLQGHESLVVHRPAFDSRDLLSRSLQVHVAPGWTAGRPGRILWERLALPKLARSWGADVLHAPGYVLPPGWQGPVVLTVYDILAISHPEWCQWANALHFRHALPVSVRRADVICVPSQVVKAELVEHLGVDPGNVRVVPLGVGPEMRPASCEAITAARELLDLPERYLLWVGNIEPKKNVTGLVRAFELVAGDIPHELVIVGKAAWKSASALQAIERSPVAGRVRRLGYVPSSLLPALYSGADLLVHWALYEGAGLTPLEAMACGTPAIVSDGGALPEIAGTVAPVVPLGEPSRLAVAIRELVYDRRRREDLAEDGRRWAAQYTWVECARRTIELYEEAQTVASTA